jgi:hypothetical protein
MLILLGRSKGERVKSAAIVVLASLLMISLWQLAAQNSEATRGNRLRDIASGVAQRFAIALTTYDYAHPNVQLVKIAAISSPVVRDRVSSASRDVVNARASSVGAASDPIVTTVSTSHAGVLVRTSQIVTAKFVAGGIELTGLLEVKVNRAGDRWVVGDYRWLVAPEPRL